MIKEQLVELAKQKNYTSFHTVNRDVGDGWYIELCLLQKWLRDKYKMFVIITEEFYSDGINHLVQILTYDKISNTCHNNSKCSGCYGDNGEFNTYEEALEYGLYKALKLI